MESSTRRLVVDIRNDIEEQQPDIYYCDNDRAWTIDIEYKEEICSKGTTRKIKSIHLDFLD